MNYSTVAMLVNDEIMAMQVLYEENGKPGIFKTILKDLKVDDIVVVESSTRWGYTTAKVSALNVDVDFDSSDKIGWIVGQVSLPEHEKIKQVEAKAIELVRRGELRKRREDILKNTFDAATTEEISKLEIVQLGHTAIADGTQAA